MLASLINSVEFIDTNNVRVVLQKDTVIWVDYNEGIACYDGICFDIFSHEYRILN